MAFTVLRGKDVKNPVVHGICNDALKALTVGVALERIEGDRAKHVFVLLFDMKSIISYNVFITQGWPLYRDITTKSGERLMYAYDAVIWGKKDPFCSLMRHMAAVGACVGQYLSMPSSAGILKNFCLWMHAGEEDVISHVSYIAAMHDIGKVHPRFQIRSTEDIVRYSELVHEPIRHSLKTGFRHEDFGAELVKDILWKEHISDRRMRNFFSAIIRMHHQGKSINSEPYDELSAGWLEIARDIEKRAAGLFKPKWEKISLSNQNALGVLISSMVILCDWVVSSREFECEAITASSDLELCDLLKLKSGDMLRKMNLSSDSQIHFPQKAAFTDFWTTIPRSGMRPLQIACEQKVAPDALLTIIEAPMGEGKTEAALYLAGRMCAEAGKSGIYMALPTSATSNQMVERVRNLIGKHGSGRVKLMHGMAWMLDRETKISTGFDTSDATSASDWTKPLRRGLLSQNAVGTVDQAMASVLRIKYSILRLLGLSTKVLIIDEIHAYDIYMSTIIVRLLEWCSKMQIPVILLSATMQEKQKARYLSSYGIDQWKSSFVYPLITQVRSTGAVSECAVGGSFMRRAYRFVTLRVTEDTASLAKAIVERTSIGGCICAMMNTVAKAQALYRQLKCMGVDEVMLFHARYTANRRSEIEKECINLFGREGQRPQKMILVCTQVVELSLDVDFDMMFTELAPMDLLLQRAGRVHRHASYSRPKGMEAPKIVVIEPRKEEIVDLQRHYGVNGYVYSPVVLRNTEKLLGAELTVKVPEDVRACVESAYQDVCDENEALLIHAQVDRQLAVAKAEGYLLPEPDPKKFYGTVRSNVGAISMEDSDELSVVGSAKTRDAGNTIQICFVPDNFPEGPFDSIEKRIEAMQWSCNIRKKGDAQVRQNGRNSNAPIIVRPDSDGFYRFENMIFQVSDEYGIEEVTI